MEIKNPSQTVIFLHSYIPTFLHYTMFTILPSTQSTSSSNLFLLDVDGTLVISKSGRKWAEDATDWVWTHPYVPALIQEKALAGWRIVLVTNQAMWTFAGSQAHAKLESILAALEAANGWRPWCFVATATSKQKDTLYRKPGRGLYDLALVKMGLTTETVGNVVMCGDACGSEDPCPSYRWADSDRAFASNIGAQFLRPCEWIPLRTQIEPSATKEILILVGNPGSGKSTTAKRLVEHGYTHVEQDLTKTSAATLRAVKYATGSVVVDATHSSKKNRAPYIEYARSLGIQVRIAWHIANGRPWNSLRSKPVPEIAYAVYSKHFEEPTEVPFVIV
jgi:bifunctional polynucleotide phosphatase/kinase